MMKWYFVALRCFPPFMYTSTIFFTTRWQGSFRKWMLNMIFVALKYFPLFLYTGPWGRLGGQPWSQQQSLVRKIGPKIFKSLAFLAHEAKRSRQKNGWTGFWTPQLTVSFFCGVLFTLEYDYLCSETDFVQEKKKFYPTTKITIPPYCLLLLCALSQDGR